MATTFIGHKVYTYAALVGNFAKAFPSVAEKARHYQRLNEYDLFIVLEGGEKILYNGFNHTYVDIPKDRSKMTHDDYKKEFTYRLNYWMERENITQAELSKMSDVDQTSINMYVHGHRLPGVDKAYKLAMALHRPITEFRYYW